MKRKITVHDLEQLGACDPQINLFEKTFPHGAYITAENYQKADDVGLDLSFLEEFALYSSQRRGLVRRRDAAFMKYLRDDITLEECNRLEAEDFVNVLKEHWSPHPRRHT